MKTMSMALERLYDQHAQVYSIGWNQKDDGGQVAWTNERKKQVDLTGGDWVWFSGKELFGAPMR